MKKLCENMCKFCLKCHQDGPVMTMIWLQGYKKPYTVKIIWNYGRPVLYDSGELNLKNFCHKRHAVDAWKTKATKTYAETM